MTQQQTDAASVRPALEEVIEQVLRRAGPLESLVQLKCDLVDALVTSGLFEDRANA